jgi:hypothetical protein
MIYDFSNEQQPYLLTSSGVISYDSTFLSETAFMQYRKPLGSGPS